MPDRATIKARFKRYNNIDGVWTFRCMDVTFALGPASRAMTLRTPLVEVVALDAKVASL